MNYDPEQEHRKDVYLCLINMYLSPPDLKGFGIEIPEDTAGGQRQGRLVGADTASSPDRHHQGLLILCFSCIDLCSFSPPPPPPPPPPLFKWLLQVLDLLPASTKLTEIEALLGTVVQERTLLKRRTQVMRSLLLAEHLQVCMSCAQLCHIESH